MKFGVCARVEKSELVKAAGFDYIELSVAGDLMPEIEEAEWDRHRWLIEAMPLLPESFNSFIRSGKITGPEADTERLKKYVKTALRRASLVGGSIIVFGSNTARNIPDGFPRERALQQIEEFLIMCADESDQTGVKVAIEPLHSGESNIINLVSEGAEIARKINRMGVQNLADTFHMEKENEPVSAIVDSADVLAHVHTADTDRFAPGIGLYDHPALFRALRDAGYDDRLSIECDWQDKFDENIMSSLQHLKKVHTLVNG